MRRKSKNAEIIKKISAYIEEEPKDKEYIKSHVSRYPQILECVDQEVFEDREFCKKLLSINGMLLEYMPDAIRKDKELVILALKNSAGFAFCYANRTLRADIEVVKHAILKYKYPLIYASEELQIYYKEKWDKYYKQHKERNWGKYRVSYNGIKTPIEEIDKIHKNEIKTKKKKKEIEEIRKNEEYEAIKDFLQEQQIKFNEYSFEEKDED